MESSFFYLGGNWCNVINKELNNEKDKSIWKINTYHRIACYFCNDDNGADQSQARLYHHEQW